MKPQRIQLSRKKGFRLPENTVVVARPSKWGNPYTLAYVHEWYNLRTERQNRAQAVDLFRDWLRCRVSIDGQQQRRRDIIHDIAELRGKHLACWCPLPKNGETDICHATVLLEIANAEPQK